MNEDVLVLERITEEIAVGMLHIQLWDGFKHIENWGFQMGTNGTFWLEKPEDGSRGILLFLNWNCWRWTNHG